MESIIKNQRTEEEEKEKVISRLEKIIKDKESIIISLRNEEGQMNSDKK